jgi:hypothetical protein
MLAAIPVYLYTCLSVYLYIYLPVYLYIRIATYGRLARELSPLLTAYFVGFLGE